MADLRALPRVDALASSPLLEGYSHVIRVRAARAAVEHLRTLGHSGTAIDLSQAESLAALEAARLAGTSLRRVLNCSGVILHTGLGRARLPDLAVERLSEVAADHSAVEIDLESGERGDRQAHVRRLLKELTGADDAYVVNNCAAAILLTLSALGSGKEILLSRGEMIEIGGSFRMPDIIEQSGCRLVEVGCTNKTRLSDYRSAIGEQTGAILRCHPSNYRIVGFTESPSSSHLKALAREHGLLFLHDLGNGLLYGTEAMGIGKETTVMEAVAEGADIVTASGDKMLGGPQAGLILGSRDLVAKIARHPLARAVRVDKLTLAALEATLQLHESKRLGEIPTYRYLSRSAAEVKRHAKRIAASFPGKATVEAGWTEVGGGSAPGAGIATWRVGLHSDDPDGLAKRLRSGPPAVLGRIEKERVWLDPRTLEDAEVRELCRVLATIEAR